MPRPSAGGTPARPPHNCGGPQTLLGGSCSDSADSALALGHCHERGRCVLHGLAAAFRAIRMSRGMFREMFGFLEQMAALLAAVLIDGHGIPPRGARAARAASATLAGAGWCATSRCRARVRFILGQGFEPRSVKVLRQQECRRDQHRCRCRRGFTLRRASCAAP